MTKLYNIQRYFVLSFGHGDIDKRHYQELVSCPVYGSNMTGFVHCIHPPRIHAGTDPWLTYNGHHMRKNKACKGGKQGYACDYFSCCDRDGNFLRWMRRHEKEKFTGHANKFFKCRGRFKVDLLSNTIVAGSEYEHCCQPE